MLYSGVQIIQYPMINIMFYEIDRVSLATNDQKYVLGFGHNSNPNFKHQTVTLTPTLIHPKCAVT